MTAKTAPVDPWQEAEDNAPIGEPLTEEERRLLAEAHADIAAGRVHAHGDVLAIIEEMRRKQVGE